MTDHNPSLSDPFDRRVHAEHGPDQIVRYDRAGKWWVETPTTGYRRHVTLRQAVDLAMSWPPESVHLGLLGGQQFDKQVRSRREQ